MPTWETVSTGGDEPALSHLNLGSKQGQGAAFLAQEA